MFVFEDFFEILVLVSVLSISNKNVETCLRLPFWCGEIFLVALLKPHVGYDKFIHFSIRFIVREHKQL